MHLNSLRLIEDCDIVMAHVFPFSPKRGTPAARMPQLEPELVRARARRLREAAARRKADWLRRQIGSRRQVLVEREDGLGHAENFAPVRVLGRAPIGGIVEVGITGVEGEQLLGVIE